MYLPALRKYSCVNMEKKSRDVIGVLTQLGKGWLARELAQ